MTRLDAHRHGRRGRHAVIAVAGLLASVSAAPHPANALGPASPTCDVAAAAAETRYNLPAGLLQAIGRVESGRRDPATHQRAPWPWTINAQGRGQQFESQADAVAATRALQQSGVASIDVGCFQVNLAYHPAAFAAVEDGFDPDRNADYAARFLTTLHARTGGWNEAVAAYHSATPDRGGPYRDQVLATWSHAGTLLPGRVASPSPIPIRPIPIRMVTWSPNVGAMHVWTPSAPGQGAAVIRIDAPHSEASARLRPRP